eukprot:6995938-Alexandrium_andersonii.AAC.1
MLELETAGTCLERLKRCRPSAVDPPVPLDWLVCPPDTCGRCSCTECMRAVQPCASRASTAARRSSSSETAS